MQRFIARMKGSVFCFVLLASIMLFSCKKDSSLKMSDLPEIQLNTVAYDALIFENDSTGLTQKLDDLGRNYPEFTPVYFQQVIGVPMDTATWKALIVSSDIQSIQSKINAVYPNPQKLSQQATDMFRSVAYHLPESTLPQVYFCNSLLNYGAFTVGDTIAAVGLDFFLGSDYDKYNGNTFPAYIKRRMTPAYWPAKMLEAWLSDQMNYPRPERMIDHAIKNGAILYLKKQILFETPDSIIFEHTADQMQWLVESEADIWGFLLDKELLYNRQLRTFQKLVNPSPNGMNGMPAETPGRSANYIGYRIIESFMKRNATLSLQDLLNQDNFDEILKSSKYKPQLN